MSAQDNLKQFSLTFTSYDGDEAATDTKPAAPAAVESTASASAPVQVKPEVREEPGYGEEPDTAAITDSFDDYTTNEPQNNHAFKEEAPDYERPQSTVSAARDEPLQMKEDG